MSKLRLQLISCGLLSKGVYAWVESYDGGEDGRFLSSKMSTKENLRRESYQNHVAHDRYRCFGLRCRILYQEQVL